MLTGTFVVIVLFTMLAHYFFVERPSQRRGRPGLPQLRPITLTDAVDDLPEKVFLQPTFTWTRMRDNGEIFLGLHPLLTGLLGVDYSLELLADNGEVARGSPLVRIRQGDRELEVISPVDGRIIEGNTDFSPLPGWKGYTMRGGSWVYRIQPSSVGDEVPRWMAGEKASVWAHQQCGDLQDFLFLADVPREGALASTEDADPPAGVMGSLDGTVWKGFQACFLPHNPAMPR